MEYNIDKAREYAQKLAQTQLAQRQRPGGNIQDKFWKPNSEKRVVRILPIRDPNESPTPFYDSWTHYKFAGKNIHCPEGNFGEPCAVCDFVRKLKSEGKKAEADQIAAKLGFKAIVVERATDGSISSPKIWSFSSLNRYNSFIDLLGDEEYSKFADVGPEGWDFRVYHTPRTMNPGVPQRPGRNMNVELHVMPFRNRPLHEDPAVVARVLEEGAELEKFILDSLHKVVTSDEVQSLFDSWISGEDGRPSVSPDFDTNLDDQLAAALKATK